MRNNIRNTALLWQYATQQFFFWQTRRRAALERASKGNKWSVTSWMHDGDSAHTRGTTQEAFCGHATYIHYAGKPIQPHPAWAKDMA